MTSPTAPIRDEQRIELAISGMTCASCANRIERKLNQLDGVEATVNYATEKARVTVPAGYDPALLLAQVEKTGYTATLPAPTLERPAPRESAPPAGPAAGPAAGHVAGHAAGPAAGHESAHASDQEPDPELAALRQRLVVSAVLAIPVIAISRSICLPITP